MFAELSFAHTLDGGRAHSVALSEAVLTSRQTRAPSSPSPHVDVIAKMHPLRSHFPLA